MEDEYKCGLLIRFIKHRITRQSQVLIQSYCPANASFDDVAVEVLRNVVPIVICKLILVVDSRFLDDRCENLQSLTKNQNQVGYSSSPDSAVVVVSRHCNI